MNTFHSPEEVIRRLYNGLALITELYAAGDMSAYSESRALSVISQDKLDFFIENGVVESTDGYLTLGKAYSDFLNKVLGVNTVLSINQIRDYTDDLAANINYYSLYDKDHNDRKKRDCLREIKRLMRDISGTIFYNVSELKLTVNDTYKNEESLSVKKQRLEDLKTKRKNLYDLISNVFVTLRNNESFFAVLADIGIVSERRLLQQILIAAEKNVREIERQIVDYLQDVEYQSHLVKKIQMLKHYKDLQRLQSDTNIMQIIPERTPLWMYKRGWYGCKPSLSRIYEDDRLRNILFRLKKDRNVILETDEWEVPILSDDDFNRQDEYQFRVDYPALFRAFQAGSDDLYNFVIQYSYGEPLEKMELIKVFCDLVVNYTEQLEFTAQYGLDDDWKYELIKAK